MDGVDEAVSRSAHRRQAGRPNDAATDGAPEPVRLAAPTGDTLTPSAPQVAPLRPCSAGIAVAESRPIRPWMRRASVGPFVKTPAHTSSARKSPGLGGAPLFCAIP